MKFSIIIPTYNRSNSLEQTIKGFLNIDYPSHLYEIIIADNNSTDNTKDIVFSYYENIEKVPIRYIFESRQGVHYARNSASKIAQNEILYFTDDDMIPDSNIFNEIKKTFELNNKIGVVTGKVLPIWEQTPPRWILRYCNNYILSLLDSKYEIIIGSSLDYLYSCHQAIKIDAFIDAEGFNPEYTKNKYMGDGETGLNTKIKNLGYLFAYNSNSIVYHVIPPYRLKQSYLNKRLENNGRAHAYSIFKLTNTRSKFIPYFCKNILLKLPYSFAKKFLNPIKKLDIENYRFFYANFFYWKGNISFSISIFFNKTFREFVVKSNWLTDDSEFDNIIF